MSEVMEALARDEIDAAAARSAIWRLLDDDEAHRDIYAALCRWTWRAMLERRLGDDMRIWHRLLLDVAARVATSGPSARSHGRGRARLTPFAAAERLRGLADLVRLSIEAAAASALREFSGRAHVLEILRFLACRGGAHIDREEIRKGLGLGDANLSRVLTLLAANGLVERLPRGRAASFRATQRGLSLVDEPDRRERENVRASMPPPPLPAAMKIETERAPGVKRYEAAMIVLSTASSERVLHERTRVDGHEEHEPIYEGGFVTGGFDHSAPIRPVAKAA